MPQNVSLVRIQRSPDGALSTLVIDGPPGNVIGIATADAMRDALHGLVADDRTRLVVLRGAGEHFSYGASIEEHLPADAPRMLASMGALVRMLVSLPVPTLAAIQGRCLGGGLELALACGMAWAEEGAILAAPEIRLGVFAPAATALLDGRIPRGMREELLLTGRDVLPAEALALGLVTRVVPRGGLEPAIEAFCDELRPRTSLALRTATRALRAAHAAAIGERLTQLERLYEAELLRDEAGSAGIRAFLAQRERR